jgi:hypothetical protein
MKMVIFKCVYYKIPCTTTTSARMRLSERILGQCTLFLFCMCGFWWPNLAILNLLEVYIEYVPVSKLIALLIMPMIWSILLGIITAKIR